MQILQFNSVSFRYESQTDFLFSGISHSFAQGWTGIAGANGIGKSTLMELACGRLIPSNGSVQGPERRLYCAQATDCPPENFQDFLFAWESESERLKAMLGISEDWLYRWDSLSHGERKRAQIAAALWARPDVLALDEPANHIDMDSRKQVYEMFRTYAGIGILVSHDRRLFDLLCTGILFMDKGGAVYRPGSYEQGRKEEEKERKSAETEYAKARQKAARLKADLQQKRMKEQKAKNADNKKKLRWKDSDGRAKIDGLRMCGADVSASNAAAAVKSRLNSETDKMNGIAAHGKRYYNFSLPGKEHKGDYALHAEALVLDVGGRRFEVPELSIASKDRVGLVGANGSGKSTLIRSLMEHPEAVAGDVLYIPQELSSGERTVLIEKKKQLGPQETGHFMAIVHGLGSDPALLLQSEDWSPGETRKMLLAWGLVREPSLIILDEPTNHMDLPSVECLENALKGFPGALLLVSHDYVFLKKLCTRVWLLKREVEEVSLSFRFAEDFFTG
ncbi:MAG: ABC-F family ATP-binding cassette domain-containing protein [Spirochaetales bacterium]|nr:ABC-F family ATP-binding cassette domain-containing protein [Spirochaetales bacterium]